MNEWISVEDRLPVMGVWVLVYDKNKFQSTTLRVSAENGWPRKMGDPPHEVTHWMPLPEPPEDKSA